MNGSSVSETIEKFDKYKFDISHLKLTSHLVNSTNTVECLICLEDLFLLKKEGTSLKVSLCGHIVCGKCSEDNLRMNILYRVHLVEKI